MDLRSSYLEGKHISGCSKPTYFALSLQVYNMLLQQQQKINTMIKYLLPGVTCQVSWREKGSWKPWLFALTAEIALPWAQPQGASLRLSTLYLTRLCLVILLCVLLIVDMFCKEK